MSTDRSILLSSAGISIDGEAALDVTASSVTERLRAGLAPSWLRTGSPASPRRVEVLDAGVVLLSEASGEFVSLFICFDPEASPFFPQVAAFHGTVDCLAGRFRGGETRAALEKDLGGGDLLTHVGTEGSPGGAAFAGALEFVDGEFKLWLDMKRAKNRFGKRTGAPRLARVVAEWGGVRPFPPRGPQPRRRDDARLASNVVRHGWHAIAAADG